MTDEQQKELENKIGKTKPKNSMFNQEMRWLEQVVSHLYAKLEQETSRAERWKDEAIEALKNLNFQMDGSFEDVKEIIERIDKGEKNESLH